MGSKNLVLLTLGMLASLASADSLASIDHVVLFMQENRAFDHVCSGRNTD